MDAVNIYMNSRSFNNAKENLTKIPLYTLTINKHEKLVLF